MGKIFTPTENDFGKTDAVVIGGGIVGTATAFWLSRAGLDVVLVEMRDGLSTLTTPASAECFRAQFAEPAMAELAIPSIEMFERFDEVIGIPGYGISIKQQGYLFLTDNPQTVDDLKENVAQQHKLGVMDSEFIERDEILTRFPYISPSVLAATFRQRDGWLSCHETTQGFAKGCEARFFINTKTTGIQMDEKGICRVETNRGILQTRVVVNAAGPFAGEIGRIHVKSGRGIHIRLSHGLFDLLEKRRQALDLVQGYSRKLPVCINFLGRLTDRLVRIDPAENHPPGFRAPVRIVLYINGKRGFLGNRHGSLQVNLLPTNRFQRKLQVDHAPDLRRKGTGRIDHYTGLEVSPIRFHPANPFLIRLNSGGFGVDKKPDITPFGKSLGGLMA